MSNALGQVVLFGLCLLSSVICATTACADEKLLSARQTFMAYFQFHNAENYDAADALVSEDFFDGLNASVRAFRIFDRLEPFYELSTPDKALVVAKPIKINEDGSHDEEVLYAMLSRNQGVWRIDRIDRASPKNATFLMTGFQMHSDVRLDLSQNAIVGAWWYPCASTIVFDPDGTGSNFFVGPAAPPPDQIPEPFKWTLCGASLRLQYADREVVHRVSAIDHQQASITVPGESKVARWQRNASAHSKQK